MTQQKKQNISAKRQKQDAALNRILLWFVGAVAVELILFLISQWFDGIAVHALAVLVPIVSVLAMVYYLYQREFFSITLVSAVSILGLWLFRKTSDGSYAVFGFVCQILALVVIVCVVLFLISLQKKGGGFSINQKTIPFFRPQTSYILMYLSCGLSALALLGSLIIGLSMAYYMIFVLVAWLFTMAVYYTVKLM